MQTIKTVSTWCYSVHKGLTLGGNLDVIQDTSTLPMQARALLTPISINIYKDVSHKRVQGRFAASLPMK